MRVLVVNAGSSSIKYKLLKMPEEEVLLDGLIEEVASHHDALEELVASFTFSVDAIVHRVVHGGERFQDVVVVDDEVEAAIEELIALAPLHNPANLDGIRAAKEAFAGVKNYAVFDTAFHQSMPLQAYKYALPSSWYDEHNIRRYGFHGSSHEYIASHFEGENIISIHLGNGASICAIKNGKSIDTSMGFTPLEGLVMGTRSGDVDAGIVEYMRDKTDVNHALNKESGLQGLCGTNDIRTILENLDKKEYAEALEIYVYRVKKYIGAYAVALGRLDAIVFTAGVGEHASRVRELICEGMEILNIRLDNKKNSSAKGKKSFVQQKDSVKIAVIQTDEELMMAKKVFNMLKYD